MNTCGTCKHLRIATSCVGNTTYFACVKHINETDGKVLVIIDNTGNCPSWEATE